MTPAEFKAARQRAKLTQGQLAELLGLGKNGDVTIRRWEMPPDSKSARAPNPIACQVFKWLESGELKPNNMFIFRPARTPHE